MVSATSARARGARVVVPAKITSSILPPRRLFAPCSPMTQERASTTLDLPEPLGPTTQVMPGSRRRVVAEANDLKPRSVRDFRYTRPLLPKTATRCARLEHHRHPKITAPGGDGPETARERKISGLRARWQKPPSYPARHPPLPPGGRPP